MRRTDTAYFFARFPLMTSGMQRAQKTPDLPRAKTTGAEAGATEAGMTRTLQHQASCRRSSRLTTRHRGDNERLRI